jgi:imidazolonepropionase-like amidohydrolase
MDKRAERLPSYDDATTATTPRQWMHRRQKRRTFRFIGAAALTYLAYTTLRIANNTEAPASSLSTAKLQADLNVCSTLKQRPIEPEAHRDHNKRWVKSTKPVLIRNATIWTGEPAAGTSEEDARAGKGWGWITSDVFTDKGLIIKVHPKIKEGDLPHGTEIFDAKGRQLTAGIVDMHSHAGLESVGNLQSDDNEMSTDITPYVRSLDAIDPLQPEFEYIKSGGVTTSLFLPGSGNNIGGEAFVLKFAVGPKNGRAEISQEDLFADPDKNWRYLKMACGENPKRVYGKVGERGPYSRLGEAWEFRHALELARTYVQEQDDWCAKADAVGVEKMDTYLRQDLQWETLGAVLRGQVRVNTHCYTVPDLEAMVRHTNEFEFRVYAFHHAHQTYLIPEVLKRTWGGTPAAALFADNMYYKVEAYTASEQAGAILYAHNITPTYVSDNPVINSQHVVLEAAKAYGYGLPYHAALAGVTSAPAELLGLGNRVGKIKPGFDADIVVWDSDPLSAGATPVQVWIDGAKQFADPIELKKPLTPAIQPDESLVQARTAEDLQGTVIYTGITRAHGSFLSGDHIAGEAPSVAIVSGGKLTCVGSCVSELAELESAPKPVKTIRLEDGHLTPPLVAFGSSLGLAEIDAEDDTQDGPFPEDGITFAADGLSFGGKQLARAVEHGVTRAFTAPGTGGIDSKGVSVGFNTAAKNVLDVDAITYPQVALHYPLTLGAKGGKTPSISSVINGLRTQLLEATSDKQSADAKTNNTEAAWLKRVVAGESALVLSAHSADTIASVIRLKSQIETASSQSLRIVIIGGAEAHLVADELAAAKIAVVLAPLLPHAQSWDQRRGLTGPPLTNVSTNVLLDAGVQLGVGVEETWETRDLGLLAGIAYANGEGRLSFEQAIDLVGGNFYEMLGLKDINRSNHADWVIWEGSPLEIGGKVRAVGGAQSTRVWE